MKCPLDLLVNVIRILWSDIFFVRVKAADFDYCISSNYLDHFSYLLFIYQIRTNLNTVRAPL